MTHPNAAATAAALLLLAAAGITRDAQAGAPESDQSEARAAPKIAIIIDDLGNQRRPGLQAVQLPGPVALAFLPATPFARELAVEAHARGKEVLLHLPMQPARIGTRPGPGGLSLDHTRGQLVEILSQGLDALPHVTGVNNHMGSLLTRHPGHMTWIMEELAARPDLFFIDSYTTHLSVALQVAREQNVPAMKRDVFLDRVVTDAAMARELIRLKNLARERGFAIGIGHPHRETLAFLARELAVLEKTGFELVPLRTLLPYRAQQKAHTWHAYSAP